MIGRDLLKGDRIILSAWTDDDISIATTWSQNTKFMRMLNNAPASPQTPEMTKEWIDRAHKASDEVSFAVRTIQENRLIGLVEFEKIDWVHRSAEIGVAIGSPEDRGKGYGTEAMNLLLDFGFHELNLHRIYLHVFSYNTRGIKTYEKLGFTHEGTLREALERDGQRFDILIYGLLRHEFTHSP